MLTQWTCRGTAIKQIVYYHARASVTGVPAAWWRKGSEVNRHGRPPAEGILYYILTV